MPMKKTSITRKIAKLHRLAYELADDAAALRASGYRQAADDFFTISSTCGNVARALKERLSE